MTREEAIARWEAFLPRLSARADETLAAAEEGCAALLTDAGLDPQPVSVAWMAIENQLRELHEKIDQTFEEKVAPALEDDADAEREKGEALKATIDERRDRVELKIFAAAARRIFEQARVELSKEVRCAQCGAPIPLRAAFFRSHHLACPHCQNVNTFVPGATIASVEYFCAHHLAREKTAALHRAWLEAERRQDDDRPAAEAALRAYTTAYLRARIEIVPEYERDFEKDLKGKMAFFYERQP